MSMESVSNGTMYTEPGTGAQPGPGQRPALEMGQQQAGGGRGGGYGIDRRSEKDKGAGRVRSRFLPVPHLRQAQ